MNAKSPSNRPTDIAVDEPATPNGPAPVQVSGPLLAAIAAANSLPAIAGPTVLTGVTAAPTTVAGLVAGSFLTMAGGTVDAVTSRISALGGGTPSLTLYGTDDGTNLFALSSLAIGAIGSGAAQQAMTAIGAYTAKGAGVRALYLVQTSLGAGTGATATLSATPGETRISAWIRGSLGAAISSLLGTAAPELLGVQGAPGALGIPVGATTNPSSTITRPADTIAYAAGDLVANNVTAGSVAFGTLTAARSALGAFTIARAMLRKSGTGITNAAFRVLMFAGTAPVPTNGDNGVLLLTQAANFIGAIDFPVPVLTGSGTNPFSDGTVFYGTPVGGNTISRKLAAGTDISWVLECRGVYTPISAETFTFSPEVLQD